MARPLRINVADGWYHCMNRGIERRSIYADDRDRGHFLDLLGDAVDRYRFRIHAYCLMANHWHAIIQTPDANLSAGLQWVGQSYSSWFNARHHRVGHLFQGRFKSIPVEAGYWAREVSLYVHLNPVRTMEFGLDKHSRAVESAGIGAALSKEEASARLKRLREYRWSSYRVYGGYALGPDWLCSEDLLRDLGKDGKERRAAYRARAQRMLVRDTEADGKEKLWEAVAIGGSAFVERMKRAAGRPERETAGRGRLKAGVTVEAAIRALEEERGTPRASWLDRHGDCGKWMVMRLVRRHSSLTLSELGRAMGGVDYSAVSEGLRWFEKRFSTDASLKRQYRHLCQILNLEM